MSEENSSAAPAPRLRRVLTFWDLIFYGIVIIQPTAPLPAFGIVNTVSQGHAVTAILLAMVAMMLTALSYGRMAAVYPTAGSAYSFVGKELHPNLGLLTGWSIALDYILGPTIGVIWCSKAAMNLVPLPFGICALFFAVLFGLVNLLGVKANARTNTVLTVGMCTVVALFFLEAIAYLFHRGGMPAIFNWTPFYNPQTFSWPAVRTSTSIAVLTYMGFDSISTLSEDVENPRRNILLATVSLCLLTGVLGGLEVYFGQLVWPDFHNYPDIDTAFVAVGGRVGGRVMFQAINATLLVATIGSSIGAQLGAARLLYAMGRDNVISRRFFGQLESRRNTPRNNILFLAAITAVGAFCMSYQAGAELLNYGAFIAFMGVNLACARRMWVDRKEGRSFLTFTNVFLPILGFIVCVYIWASLRRVTLVIGTLWLAAGVIYCAIRTGGFRTRLQLMGEVD